MKFFLIIIILSLLVFSKSINCVVPYNIVTKVKPLFKDKIAYNKLHINIQTTLDNEKALKYLVNKEKVKFAIIRRDVLWHIQQTKGDFKNNYILISELPFYSMLYLVQSLKNFDIDLDALVKKQVSIGSLGDISKVYLKDLLNNHNIKNRTLYKSIDYLKSIKQIEKGKLDVYFGFLLPTEESDDFHFQTLFSEQTIKYFKNKNIFNVDYNGIYSPYVLVASLEADDKEIESIIYRLMEKEIFTPVTDERFGIINRYVFNHLDQVKKSLKNIYESNMEKVAKFKHESKVCREYHYSFLKLLRQKPAWKKKLKRLVNPQKRKELIKAFNKILLQIDKEKSSCNLKFLNGKKIKLNNLINSL